MLFFIIQFLRSAYPRASHQKQIQIKLHAILAFLAFAGTFTAIVIFFDTRLEQLSHQFLYSILKKHSFYGELFVCVLGETVSGECSGFYAFSIIPMFLIVFGHLATVVVIFDIGSRVSELDRATDKTVWKEKVSFVFNIFREKFYALSAILFTSSVCTTYYFHVPLSVIGDEEGISAYRSFASSMSMTWGITFSLTLCAIIVLPYLRYRSCLYSMSVIRRGQAPNEADGLIAVNEGYLILKENFGFVLSSLSPVVGSIVGTVLN